MTSRHKISIKLTRRANPSSIGNELDNTDRLVLQSFVECQKNYGRWGSFDSDEYDNAVEFRRTVKKYMDKFQKREMEAYSRSKDGYYDYARWLLTGKIPHLSKPRKSIKWLARLESV